MAMRPTVTLWPLLLTLPNTVGHAVLRRTGLGSHSRVLFCRDHLQPAESLLKRDGAAGLQDGVTAQSTTKTDSKNSNLVELGSLPKLVCYRYGFMKRMSRFRVCRYHAMPAQLMSTQAAVSPHALTT